jgi:hypothetical protein
MIQAKEFGIKAPNRFNEFFPVEGLRPQKALSSCLKHIEMIFPPIHLRFIPLPFAKIRTSKKGMLTHV